MAAPIPLVHGVHRRDRLDLVVHCEYWVSVLLMCEAAVALVCCPLFGYIIDISPTRRLAYLLGLILLGASMGLLAIARSVALFVAARLLQGSATAVVIVAGLALLTDSVAFDNLGQTIGYLGSSVALGFMLGPLLGGLVYNAAGYHAVFAVAFALVGVDLVMRVAVIEKKVARQWIAAPDDEPAHAPHADANTTTIPTKPPQPALLLIARQPRVLISSWGLLVHGILYSSFDATIPIFVESRFGWGPLGAGMTFLPSALTAFLGPVFGHLSDRCGACLVTFTGFLLLAPPLVCLRFVESAVAPTTAGVVLLLALLTIIGLFINLCVPALYVETQQELERMERTRPGLFGPRGAVAQAFGIQTMAQFMGMLVGPLWGGFVADRFGWAAMVASLGVLAGGTAVPMLWLSGRPQEHEGNDAERERLLPGSPE
ncbi:predicted protein [Aspergillus terreus NIH2624]|uniref:Major facilitator superfamily (MFS) profile domain-containing protein n=1 Tax=Aspergillus terreus (strain NIH 2624 / FGSC A1156) TaxID=341663 RepID=Q0CXR5_ASPTN|nr:uncharacterized protein ATEG_01519 [Aspergillus terreus NIH2624]EAU38276.1 predicted protein [Aspergillus terreus NIH2624]